MAEERRRYVHMVGIGILTSMGHWLYSLCEPQVDMRTPEGSQGSKSPARYFESLVQDEHKHAYPIMIGEIRECALRTPAQTADF